MHAAHTNPVHGAGALARAPRLSPRRHYPTLHIKPYRRSPLQRLAWIFGFTAPEAGRRSS